MLENNKILTKFYIINQNKAQLHKTKSKFISKNIRAEIEEFIPVRINEAANALSRLQMDLFRELVPTSDTIVTVTAAEIWDRCTI